MEPSEQFGPFTCIKTGQDSIRLKRKGGFPLGFITLCYGPMMAGVIVLTVLQKWDTAGFVLSGLLVGILLILSILTAQRMVWQNLYVHPLTIEFVINKHDSRKDSPAESVRIDGLSFGCEQIRGVIVSLVETDDFKYYDIKIIMDKLVVNVCS